ncbi:Glutaredoxin [Nesidiocoris tenuis]|uniref:Glutaredoxin n=1 Tax=Nesidiocoris tenuis TaxID=355587 RepID=A0ABN7AEC4_9HEMI|nr:Glutaredoxin [Nesidiocoris tenuis]
MPASLPPYDPVPIRGGCPVCDCIIQDQGRSDDDLMDQPGTSSGLCQQPGNRPWSEEISQIERESPGMYAYALLLHLFENYQVVMISFTYCKWCKLLARQFEEYGVHFYKLEADLLPNMKQLINMIENLSGTRTVPQVFVDGQFVGGSSKTTELLESGGFQKMLSKSTIER